VHSLLRIEPMKDFTHMSKNEWISFLLLTFWTIITPLVCFANILEKIFSKSFANSQRYRNMIARSISKI
jgi:hypothetical protein